MDFNPALLIIFLLFLIVFCSPRIPYYEKYTSGRAWLGKRPYWAPAIIPSSLIPVSKNEI